MTTTTLLSQLETKRLGVQKKLDLAKSLCSLLKQDLADIDGEIKEIKSAKNAKAAVVQKELSKRNFMPSEKPSGQMVHDRSSSGGKKTTAKYNRKREDEMGKILVETNTKLRMYDYNLENEDLFDIFNGRKIFTILDVSLFEGDDKELHEADSVVIGIIYHKSKIAKSGNGKQVMCVCLTDLNGAHIRLFCTGKALDIQNDSIGTVVALLNPDVAKPSESLGAMGLSIHSYERVLNLGHSADLSFCKTGDCQNIINAATTKIGICATHRDAYYRNAKLQRQELAVGTAIYQVGPPVPKASSSSNRSIEKYATYSVFSEFLVSEGTKFSIREPLKPSVQIVEKEKIEAMANMHGRGADVIRKSLGIEKEPAPDIRTVFGPSALAKMRGNPHLNILSPKKKSPMNSKHSSPVKKASPLTKRARLDSDSDDGELEVVD